MRNDFAYHSHHSADMAKSRNRQPARWYPIEWLDFLHMSQADIVERTGLSKSLVSDYISGKRRWNTETLQAFADAMAIEPRDLLRKPNATGAPSEKIAEIVGVMDERRQYQALEIIKVLGEKSTKSKTSGATDPRLTEQSGKSPTQRRN